MLRTKNHNDIWINGTESLPELIKFRRDKKRE